MWQYKDIDYGILYKKIQLQEDVCLYVPIDLIEGNCTNAIFNGKQEYKTFQADTFLLDDYVVAFVTTIEELCERYGYTFSKLDYEGKDFILKYFLEEERDYIYYVQKKNNVVEKKKIDINWLKQSNTKEEYKKQSDQVVVALNQISLETLLQQENIEDIKKYLLKFEKLLLTFFGNEKFGAVNKVVVEDGKVKEILTSGNAKGAVRIMDTSKQIASLQEKIESSDAELGSIISLQGLENYIKERVFGHEKEIRFIAKNILMNYTALDGEKMESMLLLGPTGTGKTETMRAVQSYLNLPFVEVNSANLVPQGIKGISIEDYLFALYATANYDLERARKGIIFFDEFDKLGLSNADYKSPVLQILLKFLDGSDFLIDQKQVDTFTFNTSYLTQIYAGAFSKLFDGKKVIGFGNQEKGIISPRQVTEADYFGKELVTRIPHVLVYNELSKELQKEVVLHSKLSQYYLKKQRYQRQFGIELHVDDTYIEALLSQLSEKDRSMRDLNNLIISSLDEAEYEM